MTGTPGSNGVGTTGPTGPVGSASFPMLNASFTGANVTCPGLIVEKGELRVRSQGSTGGILGSDTMFVATREGDVSVAGPLYTSSTARIKGLLTLWDGLAVTGGASSFNGEVTVGSLSILDGADLFDPGTIMTSVVNDGSMFLQGGYDSTVYLGTTFLELSGDQVRVNAPLSIGTTTLESSLVVAGNRTEFPSIASVSAGLSSGAYASLALTSGAGQASWIDFMTTGASSMEARIQYSPSSLNFQHILSGTERMRLTNTGLSIGATTSESSLIAAGVRVTNPTVTGVHAGVLSDAACLALASAAGGGSFIDFTTSTASSVLGRIAYSSAGVNMQHTVGGIEQMRVTSAGVGIGTTQTPTESSLIVAGTRKQYPTIAGVHSGFLSGSNATLSLCSAASTSSAIDFQTVGQTVAQGRLQFFPTTNTFSFTSGTDTPLTMVGANVGVGTAAPISSLQWPARWARHAQLGSAWAWPAPRRTPQSSAWRPQTIQAIAPSASRRPVKIMRRMARFPTATTTL